METAFRFEMNIVFGQEFIFDHCAKPLLLQG